MALISLMCLEEAWNSAEEGSVLGRLLSSSRPHVAQCRVPRTRVAATLTCSAVTVNWVLPLAKTNYALCSGDTLKIKWSGPTHNL